MGNYRPATRSKNKRNRNDDNAELTSEIFRKILSTGQVREDDVNHLYMIWKPVCQGCRVNTKDNPNCFCGLVPAHNGTRKSGLWQKNTEIIQALGPDPSVDCRSHDSPAGLTNLGATCYANSILQFLFMNKAFRAGVYSIEPELLREQPVLNQLARLFARLHSSEMAFIDSAPFIQTLELDNSIQQDSHEFLTLLFSLLERCLSRSKVPKARLIIQDLFRGGISHVTTCSKCGYESEASAKVEDFYELELNIKGLKNLDESLDDYFSIEELEGDNQYYCESCATRVNATRSIKLRTLPAVLNFQLKRCVFLPNTTTKKKITSAFSFPVEINMAQRLSGSHQSDLIYELSAVLIHKGSAVNSGHYVAHIKDENTGQWWEFDDEHVSSLGNEPFGGKSSSSSAKSSQDIPVDRSCSSEKIRVPENGSQTNSSELQSLDSAVANVRTFSSNDAYMLMYVLKHPGNCSVHSNVESSGHKTGQDALAFSPEIDSRLPPHLSEEVQQSNEDYLKSCNKYETEKQAQMDRIKERREEVRSILSEAPVQSLGKPYCWVSTDWLRQWADSIISSTIDNSSIQCIHGKVPVSKASSVKRLSVEAWTMLHSKYDGGPTMTKDDNCTECLVEMARSTARADSFRDQRLLMKELVEAALSGTFSDGKLYYVSKPWLQQWLRRKNIDSPSEADTGPTASIRCPHGALMPEQAAGARRVLVPETLWEFISETAMAVKPDDFNGCSTFPQNSDPCAQCSVELNKSSSLEDNLREFKLRQKQNHEKLAMGKTIVLDPDSKYYLLPSSWLFSWKSYINATGKNTSPEEPETLRVVFDSLLCEKHGKLLERPPDLIWKRGQIMQKSSTADGLTFITENDWRLFCEDWDGIDSNGISAQIESSDCSEDNLAGSSEDMPISEEHINTHDEANIGSESRKLVIKTSPLVCEECIGERESCELLRKLNYSNEDISICFVSGKEPPKSILEASGKLLEANRRTSKRSRKATCGNSVVNVKVSGSTTVYQLKMMIWESFGIVKENQVLHKGTTVIDGESTCLADVNIFPGDVLWVMDSKIHENRDIADELSDQRMDTQTSEEGFRGSLLSSCISSQVLSESA
ncbi:cysteine protease [Lithospermum erythrorhizon]|uniref:Ubiquitin carboxyl-terminal hydrolase 26 n=1 Tax=Lithospermum erythrorhizon TaxID=34254 RepID=A0AAV3PPH5_LITER